MSEWMLHAIVAELRTSYANTTSVCPSTQRQSTVIIIGDTKTIDRVKIVFRESIFGPAKEHIYMDQVRIVLDLFRSMPQQEIAPERLAQGYRVNFAKEVGYLAVKARSYRRIALVTVCISHDTRQRSKLC